VVSGPANLPQVVVDVRSLLDSRGVLPSAVKLEESDHTEVRDSPGVGPVDYQLYQGSGIVRSFAKELADGELSHSSASTR